VRSARRIAVVPFSAFDPELLRRIEGAVEEGYLHACIVLPGDREADARALAAGAAPWSAADALAATARGGDPGEVRLGLTTRMLATDAGEPLFDGATCSRRGLALVSTARLRPEAYGERADPAVLRARILAAVAHRAGAALGREACCDPRCVRSVAPSVYDLDNRRSHACARCAGA